MCLCGSILLSTIWHILNCNTHNLPVSVSSYWPTGVRRCGTRWLVPHQDEDSCFHFLIFVHRIIQHFKFVHLFAMLLRVRWEDTTLLCALNVAWISPANVPWHEIVKPFLHIFSLRTESALLAPVSKFYTQVNWLQTAALYLMVKYGNG